MSDPDVSTSLGRIEAKVDSLHDRLFGNEGLSERVSGVEERVGRVEVKQGWFTGAAAALGTFIGFLAEHFHKH